MPPDRAPHETALPAALQVFPEPAFAEPWQARAFALAVLAAKRGCFTWPEWTRALALELRQADSSSLPGEEAGRSYYESWLRALQSLIIAKGAIESGELTERKRAWEDAHRRTPHGLPVSLSAP